MVVGDRVSEETYRRLALAEPDRRWELHEGQPREKPGMAFDHNLETFELAYQLRSQLDSGAYIVGVNGGRVRGAGGKIYIPDVILVPVALTRPFRGRRDRLETYDDPLPLVVEVWSPSTGGYDVDGKLAAYQQRGDEEIWDLHPYERTLTAWQRRPDGTDDVTIHHGGRVPVAAIAGVEIDLDALFAR